VVGKNKGVFDIDQGNNLIAAPENATAHGNNTEAIQKLEANGGLVKHIHSGSHSKWNDYVKKELERTSEKLEEEYGSLENTPKEVLKDGIDGTLNRLRQEMIEATQSTTRPKWLQDYQPKDGNVPLKRISQTPNESSVSPIIATPQPPQNLNIVSVLLIPRTIDDYCELTPQQIYRLDPKQHMSLYSQVNNTLKTKPHHFIGAYGSTTEMSDKLYSLKAQGDKLGAQIQTLTLERQKLDQRGERSMLNWIGHSPYEYNTLTSQINTLQGRRNDLEFRFNNLQSYLRKTLESEDRIAEWEQNPQNQKAQTLAWVLEDPSIQQSVKVLQAEAPRSIVREQQMELG
jgi:hypothetical protein